MSEQLRRAFASPQGAIGDPADYVFAESLRIPRPGPEGKPTDAELVALAVAPPG